MVRVDPDKIVPLIVVMQGYHANDGSSKINGRNMAFSDGKSLFLGSSGTGAPADGKDPSELKQK
jgi:hypothetical protein